MLPEGIVFCCKSLPIIKRIAPALAGLAEIVRRLTGYMGRLSVLLQLKPLSMSPNLGAVVGYKNWDVSEEFDLPLSGIIS